LATAGGGGGACGEEELAELEDFALTLLDFDWALHVMDCRRARRLVSTGDIDVKVAEVREAKRAVEEASRRVATEGEGG
jgi:hypothetical protein